MVGLGCWNSLWRVLWCSQFPNYCSGFTLNVSGWSFWGKEMFQKRNLPMLFLDMVPSNPILLWNWLIVFFLCIFIFSCYYLYTFCLASFVLDGIGHDLPLPTCDVFGQIMGSPHMILELALDILLLQLQM